MSGQRLSAPGGALRPERLPQSTTSVSAVCVHGCGRGLTLLRAEALSAQGLRLGRAAWVVVAVLVAGTAVVLALPAWSRQARAVTASQRTAEEH